MMNFHVMRTEVVSSLKDSGKWDAHYTTEDSQKSDNGLYIWVVGEHKDTIKSFETAQEMFDWCYQNGWTQPTSDE